LHYEIRDAVTIDRLSVVFLELTAYLAVSPTLCGAIGIERPKKNLFITSCLSGNGH
jgi:hypothetical protein